MILKRLHPSVQTKTQHSQGRFRNLTSKACIGKGVDESRRWIERRHSSRRFHSIFEKMRPFLRVNVIVLDVGVEIRDFIQIS